MRFTIPFALLAVIGSPLRAQCPDGSPPPCVAARAPARAAPRVVDPNRIAILPFRVTTADSMLGEGLAELLATEFTGEGGPRAVDMGTMLREWRRAGGGLRAPLSQAEALRIARRVGAGLLAQGSIVGLGSRLNVTATVVAVPSGDPRGRIEPMSGPADSIEPIIRRLTSGLIAAAGGQVQAGRRTRLSELPAAQRAYMEGLGRWRRGLVAEAAEAFERAVGEDSLFARAAFMRYLASNWFELGGPSPARWARRTWELRERLSAQDRVLLNAYLGAGYPQPRQPAQSLADRREAVAQLPESPEAWYLLGDWLYHFGPSLDIRDALSRARESFERSLALDSQSTVL